MKAELEVRFLNVDHERIRKMLKAVGAIRKQPMTLMKRAIIDYPDHRMRRLQDNLWSWVRVRDEGKRVMVAYKQIAKNKTLDTHEIEFEASSYGDAIALFEAIGLKNHSEQHSRRETWELDGCEILLDEWPWLAPFVEVEGPSQRMLKAVAGMLGLNWQDAQRGNVEAVYRKAYPGMGEEESISSVEKLTFDKMPEWLKQRL